MKIKDIIFINIIIILLIIIGLIYINNNPSSRLLLLILSSITLFINCIIFYIKSKEEYKAAGAKFILIDIDKNLFKNDNDFINYVYNNFCQCSNQCIDMPKGLNKQIGYCSEIILDKDITYFKHYDNIISNAISYLIHKKLLVRSGINFYIKSNNLTLKLTWNNIKSLKDNNTKKLFWLLRKLIVDALLKRILLKKFSKFKSLCQIFSVGSTKITSDYDITLYGSDVQKSIIIDEFQILFKRYFTEDSSIVFDTNIYGKSYIYFYPKSDKFSKNIINDYQLKFYYLKPYINEETKLINLNSQLMWGIIKFLKDLSEGFDEKIFNDLIEVYNQKLNYEIFNIAQETFLFLLNQDNKIINYSNIMSITNQIEQNYKNTLLDEKINKEDIDIIIEHELIALANFYGVETYYTRGAFLDTVVNQQMLMGQDSIKLLDIDYITSILENAGFFLVHNTKSKYIIRVQKTLTLLIKQFSNYKSLEKNLNQLNLIINKFTKGTDFESQYCQWISVDNTEVNILKCEKYPLFNVIFNLVFDLLNITKINYKFYLFVPFYKIFVLNSNTIFIK